VTARRLVGVDVGGSFIKGAVVDPTTGDLMREPSRLTTPRPSVPEAIADAVATLVHEFECTGPVGIALPGVVKNGRVLRAVNLTPAWTDADPMALFERALDGRPVVLLNDADAAGVAEVHHGAGQDEPGTVLVLTFGTGVGSALLASDGPSFNVELGQLPHRAGVWQDVISAAARRSLGHSWATWAELASEFLAIVEDIVWPDLIVVGGGISDDWPHWLHLLSTRARCVVASTGNAAGIIGAAMAAARSCRLKNSSAGEWPVQIGSRAFWRGSEAHKAGHGTGPHG
jgi:polyphosphate glucokinase